MGNRSLTERKISLLCRRYVTPGTEEADISFGECCFVLWRLETDDRTRSGTFRGQAQMV